MSQALLEELRRKAESLTNGHRGDVAHLCDVVASLAIVVCDLSEHGCAVQCCPRFGWPAAAAVLGALGMLTGIVLKLIS